jgi:hypothetical protein
MASFNDLPEGLDAVGYRRAEISHHNSEQFAPKVWHEQLYLITISRKTTKRSTGAAAYVTRRRGSRQARPLWCIAHRCLDAAQMPHPIVSRVALFARAAVAETPVAFSAGLSQVAQIADSLPRCIYAGLRHHAAHSIRLEATQTCAVAVAKMRRCPNHMPMADARSGMVLADLRAIFARNVAPEV